MKSADLFLFAQTMFTSIIDTNLRTKLATFFLVAESRSFHAEEIRRYLSEPGPKILADLKHFRKQGFIRSFERGGENYFRINTRYPYTEELRGFLVKQNTKKVRDRVWKELSKMRKVKVIILTGIFTGQMNIPTDVIIVGDPTKATLKKTIERVEKEMRVDVYYSVFTELEFDERVNMHERFTRDLFENPHLFVIDKRPKKKKIVQQKEEKGRKRRKKK